MADNKLPQVRRYEVDGMVVEIPLIYNETVNRYLEDYPDYKGNPVYTPEGRPLTVCVEDACEFAEAIEPPRRIDCSDCKYYRKAAENTLFGVCHNEKRRSPPKKEAK